MIIDLRHNTENKEAIKKTAGFGWKRKLAFAGVILMLVLVQVAGMSAFEAHVINVTARVLNDTVHIDPEGGQFCDQEPPTVVLTSDDPAASIIYSLDGSDPVCGVSGLPYSGPFMLAATTLVKARACHNTSQSAVVQALFEVSSEFCEHQDCKIKKGDFCTETQGGWGQKCSGSNVGCLRDDNWTAVTGGALVVGNGFHMTFTTSNAVRYYLPDGGTPKHLKQSYTNPTDTEAGVFGSQVTALKLNVLYSAAGIGLNGPNDDTPLGELVIAGWRFAGLTVNEFLALAETVLGGDSSQLPHYYDASISDVSDAAAKINENFDDCRTDKGYLVKPDCPVECGHECDCHKDCGCKDNKSWCDYGQCGYDHNNGGCDYDKCGNDNKDGCNSDCGNNNKNSDNYNGFGAGLLSGGLFSPDVVPLLQITSDDPADDSQNGDAGDSTVQDENVPGDTALETNDSDSPDNTPSEPGGLNEEITTDDNTGDTGEPGNVADNETGDEDGGNSVVIGTDVGDEGGIGN